MAPPRKLKGKAPKVPQIATVEWTASSDDSPLETAVVYESVSSNKCAHAFRLDPLIDYLEASTDKAGGNQKTTCPLCETPVELVCDGVAAKMTSSSSSSDDEKEATLKDKKKMVTFKYRNHLYCLSVARPSNEGLPIPYQIVFWMWQTMMEFCGESTSITAQERIAQVLNMDMQNGMKILYKGKIVHPNPRQSPHAVSAQILDVCDKGGKPLVMGTRLSHREQKAATVKWLSTLLFSLMKAALGKALQIVERVTTVGKEFILPLILGKSDDASTHNHRD